MTFTRLLSKYSSLCSINLNPQPMMENVSAIRIATFDNGWGLHQCAIENLRSRALCPLPGFHAEVLLAVLTALGIPYKLVPSETKIGYYKDGWWRDGLFGALQNGTVDLLASAFMNSEQRRMNFSFSYPVHDVGVVFLSTGPENNIVDNAGLLYKVYGKHVWLALLLYLCIYIVVRILNVSCSYKFQLSNTMRKTIGFGAVIFLNLYACLLLTHLLNLTESLKVRDVWHMMELIENKQIQLMVAHEGGLIDETIKQSTHPFYKQLRKATRDNPVLYYSGILRTGDITKMVSTGRYVSAAFAGDIALFKSHDCDIRIIGNSLFLPTYSASFMTRQGWALFPSFNQALIALQGHTTNLYRKYVNWLESKAKCETVTKGSDYHPLGLISMSGAFISLLIVSALCCLCLAVEYIINRSAHINRCHKVIVSFCAHMSCVPWFQIQTRERREEKMLNKDEHNDMPITEEVELTSIKQEEKMFTKEEQTLSTKHEENIPAKEEERNDIEKNKYGSKIHRVLHLLTQIATAELQETSDPNSASTSGQSDFELLFWNNLCDLLEITQREFEQAGPLCRGKFQKTNPCTKNNQNTIRHREMALMIFAAQVHKYVELRLTLNNKREEKHFKV